MSIVLSGTNRIVVPYNDSLDHTQWPGLSCFWIGQNTAQVGEAYGVATVAWQASVFRFDAYGSQPGTPDRIEAFRQYTTTNSKSESENGILTAGQQEWYAGCICESNFQAPQIFFTNLESDSQLIHKDLAIDTERAGIGTLTASTADFWIGNQSTDTDREFAGTDGSGLFLVGIWDRELTWQQVVEQSINPRPTPGCRLFMHFDPSKTSIEAGATIFDESGYGNHGVLNQDAAYGGVPPFNFYPQIKPRRYFVATGAVTLIPADLAHTHTFAADTITQNHVLTAADISHGHTLAASTLAQNHVLAAADIAHTHTLDGSAVNVGVLLAPADLSHGHTLDADTITQNHILAAAGLAHTHTLDATTIAIGVALVPAGLSHGHTLAGASIAQNHILAAADVSHGHTLAADTITQNHVLTAADVAHTHTLATSAVVVVSPAAPADRTIEARNLGNVPAHERGNVIARGAKSLTIKSSR